ncbi:MAG: glycosyltransferase family 25 protein [Hyphomicrobiales bacterium]|nr:glycosyltransferase family 25 protein [Hyphomicrobiales bacterium]
MWHSYLINLSDNRVRLERSRKQFDALGIGFSRVDAVNGWMLSEAESARVYDRRAGKRRFKYELVKPEIGCYLSHIECWRQIAESGEGGGFIFEDDFHAAPELKSVLEAVSRDDGDWDVVKLFTLKERSKQISQRPLTKDHWIVMPYRVPTCLIGYGIRRQAADRLVGESIPFFRPVDEDMKFFWEKSIKVALVVPPPVSVGDQQTQTGTIGMARKTAQARSGRGQLAKAAKNIAFQLHYNGLLLYHRTVGALVPGRRPWR